MLVNEILQSLKLFNSSPETRSSELKKQIFKLLKSLLLTNPIFQQDPKLIKACCNRMTFEEFKPYQTVFNLDDPSNKFYMVLSGSLTAYIPISTESDNIMEKEVKFYSPGEYFGELGLIKTQSRSATIRSNTLSLLAVLSKADFKKILSAYSEIKMNTILEFLLKIPIFSCIPMNDLEKLSYFFTETKLTKNQVLFKEHSSAEKVYFIQQGEFKLTKTSQFDLIYTSVKSLTNKNLPFNRQKKTTELQIAIKTDNEILGGEELLDRTDDYMHSCTCISNSGLVMAINASDFRARVKQLESWKKLSELVMTKKVFYERRVKNLSDFEKCKGKLEAEKILKINKSFLARSGILRKISPAREMSYSNFVPNLNIKVDRQADVVKRHLNPLVVNHGNFSKFNMWAKRKLFS